MILKRVKTIGLPFPLGNGAGPNKNPLMGISDSRVWKQNSYMAHKCRRMLIVC